MKFKDNVPIYLQIEEHLLKEMVQGQLTAGERLPSVRQLAVAATVNVNTVQRALQQLQAQGFIYAKRGEGNFVSNKPALLAQTKQRFVNRALTDFLKEMAGWGLDHQAAQAALTELIKKEEHNGSSQH